MVARAAKVTAEVRDMIKHPCAILRHALVQERASELVTAKIGEGVGQNKNFVPQKAWLGLKANCCVF